MDRKEVINNSHQIKQLLGGYCEPSKFKDELDRFKASFIQEQKRKPSIQRRNSEQFSKYPFQVHEDYLSRSRSNNRKLANFQTDEIDEKIRWQVNRDKFQHGVRRHANDDGVPLDPLTQSVKMSPRAKQFMQEDDRKYKRGLVRAQHLERVEGHGFNILSGKEQHIVQDKLVPSALKQDHHRRLLKAEEQYHIHL